MSIFNFYVSLREELLSVLTEIEDASQSLYLDNTTSNFQIKRKLNSLIDAYLIKAEKYGLYIVTTHFDCENDKHEGIFISNNSGVNINFLDEDYMWETTCQISQSLQNCVCPCSGVKSEHWVAKDLIYKKNNKICHELNSVFGSICEANLYAGDKRPRSAIREKLLITLLKINDQLLPEPIDVFIKKQQNKNIKS